MRISYGRHLLAPVVILTLLFVLFESTGLDLWCSDQFYFGAQLGWLYKHSWWAEQLIHRGGRYLILSIAAACMLVVAESFSPASLFRCYRRPALYLALCIGLSTGSVAIGKATINRHCPWDYSCYGGSVPYTSIFSAPDAHQPRGHGFPAGHASGGYSLMALYFVFYGHRPAWARTSLAFALILGSIYTFGQLVRGAHFVSHSIVTIAICWFISLVVYSVLFNRNVFPARCGAESYDNE